MALPLLSNLKKEPVDKYFEHPTEGSIRRGVLNLDTIYESKTNSETILLILYQYANLVQRIFLLSDPTKSRSAETVLPKTFGEFVAEFTNDSMKYIKKMFELIGYGFSGFPHNQAQQMKYCLLVIYDATQNQIVSGQMIIVKLIKDQTELDKYRIVNEVWGVVVNPIYMMSGAGASMLLLTLHQSAGIPQYLYPELREVQQILPHITIELEVAKDSFPFIDFMQRFAFYARNGFSYAKGTLHTLGANDHSSTIELEQFAMEISRLSGHLWYLPS